MKKIIYLFIGLFVYWIIPVPKALGAGEFTAGYDVDYNVAPDGHTIVTQNITLTNKLTNLYPTKYSILIDTEKIRDVVAYDRKGVIRPVMTQKDGKTEIGLSFNDQVVGIGKSLTFTLRFINDEIAQKNGAIWEINIPGITPDPDIGAYAASLEVPGSFGSAAYVSPKPVDGKRWNKAQMMAGGVSAAYGTIQAFSLHLSYFLQNPNVTSTLTDIALPPDTDFQKIVLQSLDPKPVGIREDDDGNWLAQYRLTAGQKVTIEATVTAFMTAAPRSEFGKTAIPSPDYTKPLKYWEADDPTIVSLAQTLRTPRAIYDYVVKTLSYDYGRVNNNPTRKGAKAALAAPKNAICMEFTDLFIAIARAAGIPAREVVGYAYTTNAKLRPLSLVADVLHAWPEYWDSDQNLWIPVDPTWAATTGGVDYFSKLDFNHIAFAIQGKSSETPYPAGFYKQTGTNTKDVTINFAEVPAIMPSPGQLRTTFLLPKVLPSGLVTTGKLFIENPGSVAVNNVNVRVSASAFPLNIAKQGERIPPLGRLEIPLSISVANFFRSEQAVITATVNDEVTNDYVDIQPAFILLIPVGVGVLLIVAGMWYIVTKRSLWTFIRR